jgi:NADH:ubiquinone oxidoreductase subunit 3 (subunit A)
LLVFLFVKQMLPEVRAIDTEAQPSENLRVASSNAADSFSESFFIMAMLIVILGACMLFLFLWAISVRGWLAVHMVVLALAPMVVFMSIVLAGYAWTCKKGALDWD